MYTTYAIIEAGSVVEYPVNPALSHSIPAYWLGGVLDGKEYVFCHNREPAITYEQNLKEVTPVFDAADGWWYRSYEVVPASPEEIQVRTQAAVEAFNNTLAELNARAAEALTKELTDEQRADWNAYVTALQDVDSQPSYPWNINWPKPPDINTISIGVERL